MPYHGFVTPVGQFGDKFRKAREAKKLSLDDVSRVTKIGSRMLQAIENEHFDVLPGGVFNKGFIRAYAKHLGLNDEEAVTDYLAALRQAQIEANAFPEPEAPRRTATPDRPPAPKLVASAPAPKAPAPTPTAPVEVEELPELQLPRAEDVSPRRRQYPADHDSAISGRIVAAVIVVVILAATFFWIRHRRLTHTQAAIVTAPAIPAPASTTASASQPAPPTQSTAASQPKSSSESQQPKSTTESSTHPTNAAKIPAQEKAAKPENTTQPTPSGDKPAPVPAKSTTEKKSAPPMTLVIRATENSWISVLADGQLVSQETLIAPANTTIRATREITVRVGNAAGVSFVWNGKELPVQGAEAEVKTLTFDANGMHATATQPTQNQ